MLSRDLEATLGQAFKEARTKGHEFMTCLLYTSDAADE